MALMCKSWYITDSVTHCTLARPLFHALQLHIINAPSAEFYLDNRNGNGVLDETSPNAERLYRLLGAC